MEGDCIALFTCRVGYLERFGGVVPYPDCSVSAAGSNQLLPHTHIHSRDYLLMETADDIVKDVFVVCPVQRNVHLQQLISCGLYVQGFFLLENHGSDLIVGLDHRLV
jgi:hypothetical protein